MIESEKTMPVSWPSELFDPPEVEVAAGFDEPGLHAVYLKSVNWRGKATWVFAWVALPEGASADDPVPGVVCAHGGGGTAFPAWARIWQARGYAAIVMSMSGELPGGNHGNRLRHERGGPSGYGGFHQTDEPITDQWGYHATASIMVSHSHLASLPEVDAERIAFTGISWGGIMGCISAAVDPRYRCAVPVYGCGFLENEELWPPHIADTTPEQARYWLDHWDPKHYLPHVKCPLLWQSEDIDFSFTPIPLMRSIEAAPVENRLTLTARGITHAL